MSIFYILYALWFSSDVMLNRIARSGKSDNKSADRKTELYLRLTIILSVIAGVLVSVYFAFPVLLNPYFNYAGLVVIIAGVAFRLTAIKQLGRFFTVDITIREDHQLMHSGL